MWNPKTVARETTHVAYGCSGEKWVPPSPHRVLTAPPRRVATVARMSLAAEGGRTLLGRGEGSRGVSRSGLTKERLCSDHAPRAAAVTMTQNAACAPYLPARPVCQYRLSLQCETRGPQLTPILQVYETEAGEVRGSNGPKQAQPDSLANVTTCVHTAGAMHWI